MSSMVPVPVSVLDPYVEEKSDGEKPVKLRLLSADGKTVRLRNDGKRVLTVPPVPLRVDGRLFVYRCTNEDGSRVYLEVMPLDLDPVRLSHLQAEYIGLTERIENPILHDGFGVKSGVTSVEHGTAVVRRQEIAFKLVDDEISRVLQAALKR